MMRQIIITNYLDTFRKLGLTENEAKVYINLLKKQSFSATEIAKLTGTSRVKIYEILKSLIGKGLCVEILSRVRKYAPVDPEVAIDNLIIRNQQQYSYLLEQQRVAATNIKNSLSTLYLSERGNIEPLDYIEVVHEKNLIANKIMMLLKTARKEILAFSKAPYAMDINPENVTNNILKFGDDIDVRSIYEIADAQQTYFFDGLKLSTVGGAKIKLIESVPLKISIFDERKVVLLMENKFHGPSSLTAMVIEHTDLAKTMKKMFNIYWEQAITLEEFESLYINTNIKATGD